MNLQEVLDYRKKCIICQKTLVLKHETNTTLSHSIDETGLKIFSSHKKGVFYLFCFDGKLIKGKREFGVGYKTPFHFIKECPSCKPIRKEATTYLNPASISISSRSVGATTIGLAVDQYHTTLENIKSYGCNYRFTLNCGKIEQGYSVQMESEIIRYPSNEAFYHIHTDFIKDETILNHGFYNDVLPQTLQLKASGKNISRLKTKEDLIEKFKLYSLFS